MLSFEDSYNGDLGGIITISTILRKNFNGKVMHFRLGVAQSWGKKLKLRLSTKT